MTERELFLAAWEISDPVERDSYLTQACGSEAELRGRIELLLRAADIKDSFLECEQPSELNFQNLAEKPGTTIGCYKLIEQIGEGGFGVVFMAEQNHPVRRTVAVKVIKAGMDSRQIIARFEAERQALAIMDHPNIAKVLDAGTTDSGRPYFVMELVKGVSITQFCDHRRASLNERLELFVTVCMAIQHAHSKGVIHRDIKPGNVLVAMYDDRPIAKVIDFGVAKATSGQLTERTQHTAFGAIVGSLEYMSPEQAGFNQLDIDTRSDVYSLGVLLYELLTGTPPLSLDQLRRVGMLESLRLVREAEPVRPSARLSTTEGLSGLAANRSAEPLRLMSIVRGDLDWIVMKALEKNRSRRYGTVSNLAEEVNRFLRGEPIEAHPPSQLYRFRKWIGRNRRAVVSTAAMSLLVGAIVSMEFWNSHQRAVHVSAYSSRVSESIRKASLALGTAKGAPIGQQTQWVAARAAANQLGELLGIDEIDEGTRELAKRFLDDFAQLDADRRLAEQVESVVIMSATHADLSSWQRMEQQFRELFINQGIDVAQLSPSQIAEEIRRHRSSAHLCDALELWIGTKGQISALGGERATRETMQPLADAILAADDDPVRSGIRRLIYAGKPPKIEEVDEVIAQVDLASLTPRTLSWLATVYAMAGQTKRADEIFYFAIDQHPDDFMLNFDFAYTMESQNRWPEVVRYFLRCTALRPDVSGVWRALGNAFRENQELDRAREAMLHAVLLAPKHSPTQVDLARIHIALGQYPEAESAARTAIEHGCNLPMAPYCLAQSLFHQKRFAEALVACGDCDTLNRSNPGYAVNTERLMAGCKQNLAVDTKIEQSTGHN